MRKIALILIFLSNFLFADITQYFPELEGRVIDQAHLLSEQAQQRLSEVLKQEEENTSNQIVVVILNSLNGYEISDYSYQLGRYWQIGQKNKNNGVLLVIAMDEKKLRIEVGYGLEGALTDKTSHEIINYTLKPSFKQQRFEEGIFKAVEEIIAAIKGEYTPKTKVKEGDEGLNEIIALAFFAIIFISMSLNGFARKLKSQFLYKTSKSSIFSSFFGFFSFVASQGLTSHYILISLAIFVVVFIFNFLTIRKVDFDKLPKYSNTRTRDSYSSGYSGGFGGFGGGGFGSGGGFSGGGGSFGGGGASGGW